VRDADDRRRVIVEPDLTQIKRKIGPLFDSMGRAAVLLYSGYSVRELALLRDFAERSLQLADQETRKLQGATTTGAETRSSEK
jgi:hypothetical protein